jgi:hypothetical protein
VVHPGVEANYAALCTLPGYRFAFETARTIAGVMWLMAYRGIRAFFIQSYAWNLIAA